MSRSFIEEARMMAAQCWTDPETSHIEMDPALAEAVAKRIASWMDSAADFAQAVDYYRGLLERCGKAIGPRAYECDDGSISDSVLCCKIPEIIADDYGTATETQA